VTRFIISRSTAAAESNFILNNNKVCSCVMHSNRIKRQPGKRKGTTEIMAKKIKRSNAVHKNSDGK
jgi:hypothetical protein